MIDNLLIWIKNLFKLKESRYKSILKESGVIKDKKDSRDYIVSSSKEEKLPECVDLRNYVKEIKSQGKYQNCLSHTICSAVEIMMTIKNPRTFMPLSERYNYYYARKLSGLFPVDAGTYPRDALKAAFKYGLSPDLLCSYRKGMNTKPTLMAKIFANPYRQRLKQYVRLIDKEDIKRQLNKGIPVIVVVKIYDYWYGNKDGIIRPPTNEDKYLGLHALTCVGFSKNHFIFLNSWNNWGSKGYAYYHINMEIEDMWCIELK